MTADLEAKMSGLFNPTNKPAFVIVFSYSDTLQPTIFYIL